MQVKHTPGPWRIGKSCVGIPAVFPEDKEQRAIATFGSWRYGDDAVSTLPNYEANARLIARAPEMLEMLKRLLDEDKGYFEYSKELTKAAQLVKSIEST